MHNFKQLIIYELVMGSGAILRDTKSVTSLSYKPESLYISANKCLSESQTACRFTYIISVLLTP